MLQVTATGCGPPRRAMGGHAMGSPAPAQEFTGSSDRSKGLANAKRDFKFPVSSQIFPVPIREFPVPYARESGKKWQREQSVGGEMGARFGSNARKSPVFSLLNREFGGDRFARDCLHRQQVLKSAAGHVSLLPGAKGAEAPA